MQISFAFAVKFLHHIRVNNMKKRLLKAIKIIGIISVVLLIVLIAAIFWSENDKSVTKEFVKNENLSTIKNNWQGTPVDEKGRFVNHEFPYLPKTTDILKWTFGAHPQKQEKNDDKDRLEIKDPTEFLNSETDGILWFGHASFLIRLNGVNILLDPVFGEPSFITRFVSSPSPIEKLKKVDFILISHDHRDHCDAATIEGLTKKFPAAKILTGLKMNELIQDWNSSKTEIQTAGWYQQFKLPDDKIKISFLPSRHWSRRGLFDTNARLWGAFVIEGAGKTIYFSGDSGFGSHYKELAEIFPKIDFFIIGIGAYQPQFIMKPNHNTPSEAFQGFLDSRADVLIPMHFGRFDLSDEPPSEPLRLLKEKAAEANLAEKIKNLQINESLAIN